jgi:hypothetical protein
MTDILQDLSDKMSFIEDKGDIFDANLLNLYTLISRAAAEIGRLRKINSDMEWELNPDRSGGQFTQDEIDLCGGDGEGW